MHVYIHLTDQWTVGSNCQESVKEPRNTASRDIISPSMLIMPNSMKERMKPTFQAGYFYKAVDHPKIGNQGLQHFVIQACHPEQASTDRMVAIAAKWANLWPFVYFI